MLYTGHAVTHKSSRHRVGYASTWLSAQPVINFNCRSFIATCIMARVLIYLPFVWVAIDIGFLLFTLLSERSRVPERGGGSGYECTLYTVWPNYTVFFSEKYSIGSQTCSWLGPVWDRRSHVWADVSEALLSKRLRHVEWCRHGIPWHKVVPTTYPGWNRTPNRTARNVRVCCTHTLESQTTAKRQQQHRSWKWLPQ